MKGTATAAVAAVLRKWRRLRFMAWLVVGLRRSTLR
jgi:hypothetical protein